MSSLQQALGRLVPQLKLVEHGQHIDERIQQAVNAARKQDSEERGPDGVLRTIGAIELEESEPDAIAWFRQNGIKRMSVAILAIRLNDGSLVLEVRVQKTSRIRTIHLATRLRKAECRVQNVRVPEEKMPLLTAKGQPDFKALRNWLWDPEGEVVIRSQGTIRLSFEETFTTLANAITENYAIEGLNPPRRR